MHKTNINELVQSIERSLLLIYKNRFSFKQILGNSDFLDSNRKFGQSHFLKKFSCFFNYYFEEINIFYFNLKLA